MRSERERNAGAGESMFVTLGGPQGYREQIGIPILCECDFAFAVADINVDGHPDIIVNSVEETELPSTEVLMVRSLGSTAMSPRLAGEEVLYWRSDTF